MTPREYGHFTTMQVRRRAVQGLRLHLQRLVDATHELFECALDPGAVSSDVAEALDRAGCDNATVRVTVSADSMPRSADAAGAGAPRIEPGLRPRIEVSVSSPLVHDASPMRLLPVIHRRTLPHVKHVGTFASHHHRRLALRDGADDALFVDADGLVLEGTFWNIGFWRGDTVAWPDAPALRGTGERLLREGLASAGGAQVVAPVRLDALGAFDGAFIVNARGVRAVQAIGEVAFDRLQQRRISLLTGILGRIPWDPLSA